MTSSDPRPLEAAEESGSQQLVKRIVARRDQIVSGRILYRRVLLIDSANEESYRVQVAFSGPSWISRYLPPKGEGTSVSHNGKMIRYLFTKQLDGSVRHTADISLPSERPEDIPMLAAGSRWGKANFEFIQTRAMAGRLKKSEMVAGVECQVWEWDVAKADVSRAFGSYSDVTEHGGFLRLYVAPQLGYTVPRIDHVGHDGRVGSRYECRDYREVAPGIFLPFSIRDTFSNSKGIMTEFAYVLETVDHVNEQVSADEFKVSMAIGTEVFDRRPGHQTAYVLTDDLPLSVTGLTDVELFKPPSFLRRNRTVAVLVGIAAALTVVSAMAILRRRRARRLAS